MFASVAVQKRYKNAVLKEDREYLKLFFMKLKFQSSGNFQIHEPWSTLHYF